MTRKGTLRIKICGLQRLADVEAVNRCRPDWAGFVFAPGRRRICPEEARVLRAALRKDIPVFGVFVNAPVEEAAALAREGILDGIQLHGDEDAAYVDVLRHRTAVPVWQACRVRPGATDAGQRTAAAVGMIVLDAFSPAASSRAVSKSRTTSCQRVPSSPSLTRTARRKRTSRISRRANTPSSCSSTATARVCWRLHLRGCVIFYPSISHGD